MRGSRVAALVGAVALAGCPKHDAAPTSPPPPTVAGPKVALPDGGMRHTERLATAAWRGGAFRACGERNGGPSGCKLVAAAGERASDAAADGEGFAADRSPPTSAPGVCRVLFDDAPGDPAAPPARATLVGPAARQPLDEWRPAGTVDGDYFAVETSFSPDGKWLAVYRVAVGLGTDERLVELAGVQVRPAPACR